MGIETTEDRIVISGRIGPEEAEQLLGLLRDHPGLPVDLQSCEHLHAAALQVMMALSPPIATGAADVWLCSAIGMSAVNAAAAEAHSTGEAYAASQEQGESEG